VQPLTVRTADVAAEPWKNGGGVTRELLALPRGGNWRVRVSVADVASDGDFSTFAGVARWFAVVEGAGVVLTIDGRLQREAYALLDGRRGAAVLLSLPDADVLVATSSPSFASRDRVRTACPSCTS